MKKLIITISILGLTILMNVAPAFAQSGKFTIYPTYMHDNNKNWIITDISQGSNKTESVTIENLTSEEIEINLLVREAEETKEFVTKENTPFENIGLWTSLSETKHTLKPYEKKQVKVSIQIPENASMQQYLGTILASMTEKNTENLSIQTRIGVRTYINVTKYNPLQTNIFNSVEYKTTFFFLLSLVGVLGSLFFSTINYFENKKNHA